MEREEIFIAQARVVPERCPWKGICRAIAEPTIPNQLQAFEVVEKNLIKYGAGMSGKTAECRDAVNQGEPCLVSPKGLDILFDLMEQNHTPSA